MIASGAKTLGEGYHHVRGEAHAEVEALRDARERAAYVRGATLYVTLEPCNHSGLTPPCTQAVREAGIKRVVVGAMDPNPRVAGGGVADLRASGVVVDVADDAWARELIEDFSYAIRRTRPYVRLKMAASLDGYIAPRPGERHWLTGREAREYVRELRATHDAVMVGAGTVRVDDPKLSVRPWRSRRRPYVRVVACEETPPPVERAVFAPLEGYAPTIALAPPGRRAEFAALEEVADVAYAGAPDALTLDLAAALDELRARGIASVLCEGGPTLAARLIERGLVDRIDWLLAPALLRGPDSVPSLAGGTGEQSLRFDRVERLGTDVLLSALFVPA